MDPYAVLGVSESASDAEIKATYRRLAKKYHPDVNKSDAALEMTARINAAYDILSDPRKKAAYDNRFSFVDFVAKEDPVEIYKREFKRRKIEEARQKAREKRERQAKTYAFYRWCCYPLAIFSLLVILDYFLPAKKVLDIPISGYQKVSYTNGRSGADQSGARSYMQTTRYLLRVPDFVHLNYNYANKEKEVLLEFTPIFGTFQRIGVQIADDTFVMYPSGTYVYFPLALPLPYVILGLSILFLRKEKYAPELLAFVKIPVVLGIFMLVWFWLG